MARLLHYGVRLVDRIRTETDMLDRIDQQMDTLRTAANLRAYRQQLLASNIANADTPNYKARDIDFQAALDKASSQQGSSVAMARTSARHLTGAAGGQPVEMGFGKRSFGHDGSTEQATKVSGGDTPNGWRQRKANELSPAAPGPGLCPPGAGDFRGGADIHAGFRSW